MRAEFVDEEAASSMAVEPRPDITLRVNRVTRPVMTVYRMQVQGDSPKASGP